jgi:hypothetical protein
MPPISLRRVLAVSLLAVLGWPAVALANHHHIGGSGSGTDDPDADCLVWGYVVASTDAATADAADGDAAASDAGAGTVVTSDGGPVPAGAKLTCLEHATLFGCDCAASPRAGDGWSRGAGASVAAMLLAARRRRRAPSPGVTP